MSLTPDQVQAISTASASPIQDYLASRSGVKWVEWLPSGHILEEGVRKKHHPSFSSHAADARIIEYLAVATITHCSNGWGFFGRALSALMAGDSHSAWHYAYYAELRAALSLLSGSGVGVFNEWNCVVTDAGGITPLELLVNNNLTPRPHGTHKMAWEALGALVEGNANFQASVKQSLVLSGLSVGEVVRQAFPGASPALVFGKWIKSWTFDLDLCAGDRGLRNRASYQPHELWSLSEKSTSVATYVHDLWSLLEPTPESPFWAFDRYLFRMAIEAVAVLDPAYSRDTLSTLISSAVARLDPAFVSAVGSEFLMREGAHKKDPWVIDLSRHNNPRPSSPFPAISRSLMLLRLASGQVRSALRATGLLQPNAFSSWIDDLVLGRGLSSASIEEAIELWGDIDIGLQDLQPLIDSGGPGTYRVWMDALPGNQSILGTAERAGLWSVIQ